jgi:hypothetical protein
MRKLLVILLLGLLALGVQATEEVGILVHACPDDAVVLVGKELKTFRPDKNLARKLTDRGLGGRWRLFSQGEKLQSAIFLGADASVVNALAAQRQFIELVNKSRWPQAFAMQSQAQQKREPSGIFIQNYSGRYLSCHPEDLKLVSAEPHQVRIRVKLQLTTTATSSQG